MPRIAMIGAGSAVFAKQLMIDFLSTPGLDKGEFALVDIDAARLERAHKLAGKIISLSGKDWTVEASADRCKVIKNCDYIVNFIEVNGLNTVKLDYEIPKKYGVDQCIGDTIGPGGLFKALRTVPDWIDILKDAERLSPGAMVLNYTNPMSLMTLAGLRCCSLPLIGLCHSVQGTSRQIAGYLDVPYDELKWRCGGINHVAWFTELERNGEDMFPRLRERGKLPEVYEKDPVRFEIFFQLGSFVTESSGHMSEYVPWFRKRDELIDKYCRERFLGERGFYAATWPQWRKEADEKALALIRGEEEIELKRSHEYASIIVEAKETNRPVIVYGSVLNTRLIPNLLEGGCVEVPVTIDKNGLNPCYFGPLPEHLAAIDRAHMAFHELTVEAILNKDMEAAVHALMIDPLTAAVCSLEEIRSMFHEMLEAEREYIRVFD